MTELAAMWSRTCLCRRCFPGSALIRVRRTGICGSDLHLTNSRTDPQTLPTGHEVAGEIVELPSGETRLKVGDRVALETIGAGLCCGDCFYCNDGHSSTALTWRETPAADSPNT